MEPEITEVKSMVVTAQNAAHSLLVDSPDSMAAAHKALLYTNEAEKFITNKKEEITRPLMSSLAKVRDLFKPLESSLGEAKKIIKSKMLAWQVAQDEKLQKEHERLAKRVEKGTMKPETAAAKMEAVPTKSPIREVKKVRVVDESLVPREYLSVNLTMVTEAILRKGIVVPGVEMFIEKTIVAK